MGFTLRFLLPLVLIAQTVVAAPVLAAPSTEMLANTCASCHGTDGKAIGKMEKLYGKRGTKIADELMEMKRENKGRIMIPIVKAYSDEQIRAIGAYFELLPQKGR